LRLLAQHAQRIGDRWHPIPPQFHIVVEAAADRVHVRIVEAGDDRAAADVDHLRPVVPIRQHVMVGADGEEAPVLEGHRGGERSAVVLGGEAAVEENHVSAGVGLGLEVSRLPRGGKPDHGTNRSESQECPACQISRHHLTPPP
jgi:hypothetical protein